MSIRLVNKNIDWGKVLKKASKSWCVFIPVISHGENSVVRLFMKKVSRYYHRLTIDVDGTGYKISEQGRKDLADLINYYGLPDVREAKSNFVDTYILELEVQRGGNSTVGEERFLDHLMLMLEQSENLKDVFRTAKFEV